MTDVAHQQSRLKDLIARGKEQGYLTYSEVNDHLPRRYSNLSTAFINPMLPS